MSCIEAAAAAAKSLQSCPTGKNTGVGCHFLLQCMKVKGESEVAQSCPTLCDPKDCSLPGSSVHGIFQARVLEWVAIAFSALKLLLLLLSHFSHVQLCATPWTAAHQAPLSTEFSRQEYWSGLPFPSPSRSFYRLRFLIIFVHYLSL